MTEYYAALTDLIDHVTLLLKELMQMFQTAMFSQ
jgi:hypothetical protein